MKSYRLSTEAMVMVSGSSAGTQPKYFHAAPIYDNGDSLLSNYNKFSVDLNGQRTSISCPFSFKAPA